MTSSTQTTSKEKKKRKTETAPPFQWAVPENLKVPPDPLRVRLDFHNHAVVMHVFEGDVAGVQVVSAMDVAQALLRELPSNTGLLPKNTLWWANSREGPVYALWEEPKVWKLALQVGALEKPHRFVCPMPGLIFLCTPGQTPWVFAMKRRPTKETDIVYRAPLCNIFDSGKVCPGSHKFPMEVSKIPDSFFRSFFSPTADLSNRSVMFPQNVVNLWEFLNGKTKYPMSDLVKMGTVKDLMAMPLKEF